MQTLTQNQKARIIQELETTNKFIEKEEARDASIRPQSVQKILDDYRSHREKLNAMLAVQS